MSILIGPCSPHPRQATSETLGRAKHGHPWPASSPSGGGVVSPLLLRQLSPVAGRGSFRCRRRSMAIRRDARCGPSSRQPATKEPTPTTVAQAIDSVEALQGVTLSMPDPAVAATTSATALGAAALDAEEESTTTPAAALGADASDAEDDSSQTTAATLQSTPFASASTSPAASLSRQPATKEPPPTTVAQAIDSVEALLGVTLSMPAPAATTTTSAATTSAAALDAQDEPSTTTATTLQSTTDGPEEFSSTVIPPFASAGQEATPSVQVAVQVAATAAFSEETRPPRRSLPNRRGGGTNDRFSRGAARDARGRRRRVGRFPRGRGRRRRGRIGGGVPAGGAAHPAAGTIGRCSSSSRRCIEQCRVAVGTAVVLRRHAVQPDQVPGQPGPGGPRKRRRRRVPPPLALLPPRRDGRRLPRPRGRPGKMTARGGRLGRVRRR